MCNQSTIFFVIIIFGCCTIEKVFSYDFKQAKIRNEIQNHFKETEQKMHQLITKEVLGSSKKNIRNVSSESRTFGKLRPLKLAMPAIMYKLGIMTSMIGFLTLIALKGLIIGAILLVLQLSAALSKLHNLKKERESWDEEHSHHKVPQTIHVHIHGGHGQSGHYTYSTDHGPGPYSSWSKSGNGSPSKLDNDYYNRLKEYKELQELRDLRESLYQQVI